MSITAATVKELRERTGAGMMECKKALTEAGGDIEAAIEAMRKSGQAKAAKKSGRITAEGSRSDSTRWATSVSRGTPAGIAARFGPSGDGPLPVPWHCTQVRCRVWKIVEPRAGSPRRATSATSASRFSAASVAARPGGAGDWAAAGVAMATTTSDAQAAMRPQARGSDNAGIRFPGMVALLLKV